MTTYFPEGINAAGKGALFAAPAVANMATPKLTEYASPTGFAFHCDNYDFAHTVEQGKTEEGRYCLAQTVESMGRAKHSLEPMQIVYNPQNEIDPNYVAYLKFKEGTSWVIADRRGLDARTSALAIGQVADLIPVKIGAIGRVPITTAEGEKIRAIINWIVSGPVSHDVKFVA